MFTRQVEGAQKRVEETTTIPVNKSLQYDDVMREQQEVSLRCYSVIR